MKSKLISVKNHVSSHRVRYGIGATALVATGYVAVCAKEWHEFLKENEICDQFRAYAEMQA